MASKVLILGITGQDGSYLSDLFMQNNYDVYGIIRRSSYPNTQRIDDIFPPEQKGKLLYGDLTSGLSGHLYDIKPDIIINLAAMSHVQISFVNNMPKYVFDTNATGVIQLLEDIRIGIKHNILKKDIRFYQASSSEMFGISPPPQNELTPMWPVSPYGVAKLAAYHSVRTYRWGFNMFASNGILFNHESSRRGVNFVTRKITRGIASIKAGKIDKIRLGNLNAKRDWGHSKDYMRAIYAIMHHSEPDDFIVATGFHHSVREFIEEAFSLVGLDPTRHIVVEESYRRPNEVPDLLGDASKIKKVLGWEPQVSFKELVKEMVMADIAKEKNDAKHYG